MTLVLFLSACSPAAATASPTPNATVTAMAATLEAYSTWASQINYGTPNVIFAGFTTDRNAYKVGDDMIVSWDSKNATSCSFAGDIINKKVDLKGTTVEKVKKAGLNVITFHCVDGIGNEYKSSSVINAPATPTISPKIATWTAGTMTAWPTTVPCVDMGVKGSCDASPTPAPNCPDAEHPYSWVINVHEPKGVARTIDVWTNERVFAFKLDQADKTVCYQTAVSPENERSKGPYKITLVVWADNTVVKVFRAAKMLTIGTDMIDPGLNYDMVNVALYPAATATPTITQTPTTTLTPTITPTVTPVRIGG